MTVRTNREGGWIASFLIIGAVLVLGLTGTIYFLKTQSMDTELAGQTDNDSNISDVTTDSADEKAAAADKKAAEKKKQDAQKQAEAKKAQEKADKKAEDAANTLPSATEKQSDSKNEAVAPTQKAEELPETGPTETVASLFVVTLVAFSVVSYARSRSA